MIDINKLERDFMQPRKGRDFMQPAMPQAPTAPTMGGMRLIGQPTQFQPQTTWKQTYETPAEIQAQYQPSAIEQAMVGTQVGQAIPFSRLPSDIGVGIQTQPFAPVGQPPISGPGFPSGQPPPFTPVGQPPISGPGFPSGQPPPFTPVGQPEETPITSPVTTPTTVDTQPIPPTLDEGAWTTPTAGEPYPFPKEWDWASSALRELAETGMPAFTPEYMETAWLPYKRRAEEGALQAREAAGMTGMRWGTPLAGQMESIWGGAGEKFGSEMERLRMEDIAGMRGARLGAAGGLGGLGQRFADLPLDVNQKLMAAAAMFQRMQQGEIDPVYEEWKRQQPEYSPWLDYLSGAATGGQTQPQMYQPGGGTQALDLLAMLGMFFL